MDTRVLVLFASLIFSFLAGFLFGVYYAISAETPSVSVYAVAVTEEGEGALVTIVARMTPGFGRVFVSVTPKMELDTQASAETAVYVAQMLAKRPLGFRDVLFEIRAPTYIVEGPSAGAAMTIAAYALLTGMEPSKDAVITGSISPDGSIGPVGGLVGKLRAAAEHHLRYFLIPKGQRYYEYVEPVKKVYEPVPGLVVVKTYYVRRVVDLVELGEELGVKVVEVGKIEEALPYFFSSEPSS